jgi:hypothetical protein
VHVGYGDSSHTADGKYIIASFRADANLGWVVDLRKFLNLPELKYRDYAPLEIRNRVAANSPLYRKMIGGLADAELTIIDQQRYTWKEFFRLRELGATFGEDFTLRDIQSSAANQMILDSPLGLPDDYSQSPAMQRMVRVSEVLGGNATLQELPRTDVSELHQRSGGKFKDAVVLSARAHSMLSPSEFFELRYMAENPYMRGTLVENMRRASEMGHIFDHEHQKSVPILNELVSKVASAGGVPPHVALTLRLKGPVREEASHLTDHMQAADFAAGWAADLLTSTDSDFRALAAKVRWVSVNGIIWPS